MNRHLLDRFFPPKCYNWQSLTYEKEGEKLINEVENIKSVLKPINTKDWLKNLPEEAEDSDLMEI